MKRLIKKFFSREFDILIAIILLLLFIKYTINIYAILAVIIYGIIKSFYSKSTIITLFYNMLILLFIIFLPNLITNERQIFPIVIITVLLIIIATIQILLMMFRIFKSKIGVYPKSDFKVINQVRKMTFVYNVIELFIKILLAIIYPLIISFVIITSFSGFYNSLNHYYNLKNKA